MAPLVSFESDTHRDFFARRIGCQVFNPVYGMDLDRSPMSSVTLDNQAC